MEVRNELRYTKDHEWLRVEGGEGVVGITDFAQAVEPTRGDIGVMGIRYGTPRSDTEKAAHPALLNDAAERVRQYILSLMSESAQ